LGEEVSEEDSAEGMDAEVTVVREEDTAVEVMEVTEDMDAGMDGADKNINKHQPRIKE
jgi:hypothetical protein